VCGGLVVVVMVVMQEDEADGHGASASVIARLEQELAEIKKRNEELEVSHQSINQSINQPISQSTNQSINQSINRMGRTTPKLWHQPRFPLSGLTARLCGRAT
jgi:predicted carbohydrate-binding protein with CBM5 and CBM33 domain